MSIVIQNCVTELYLGDGDQWQAAEAQAKVFPSTWAATDYAVDHAICNCQAILKPDESRRDIETKNANPAFTPGRVMVVGHGVTS